MHKDEHALTDIRPVLRHKGMTAGQRSHSDDSPVFAKTAQNSWKCLRSTALIHAPVTNTSKWPAAAMFTTSRTTHLPWGPPVGHQTVTTLGGGGGNVIWTPETTNPAFAAPVTQSMCSERQAENPVSPTTVTAADLFHIVQTSHAWCSAKWNSQTFHHILHSTLFFHWLTWFLLWILYINTIIKYI